MRSRLERVRCLMMLFAGVAALALVGVADVSAATFRSFSAPRAPIAMQRAPIARPMVTPKLQKVVVPRTNKLIKPSTNLNRLVTPQRRLNAVRDTGLQIGKPPGGVKPIDPKLGTNIGSVNPKGPTGPVGTTGDTGKPPGRVVGTPTTPGTNNPGTNNPGTGQPGRTNPDGPTGPVAGTPTAPGNDVGRPPGRNPPNPDGPGRPRPGGPIIGPGVIIGTGVVAPIFPVGPAGPASAAPVSPTSPGAFGPPGGPPVPRGINIPPANENRFVKNEVVLEFAGNFPPAAMTQLMARHRLVALELQPMALMAPRCWVRITDGRPALACCGLAAEMQLQSGQAIINSTQAWTPADGVVPLSTAPGFTPPPRRCRPTPAAAAAAAPSPKAILPSTAREANLAEAHNLRSAVRLGRCDRSGVDLGHPELAGVVAGAMTHWAPPAAAHHGTGNAGAIARARLLGRRQHSGDPAFAHRPAPATTCNLKSVEYATAQQARVINMSFAGPYDPGLARHLRPPMPRARADRCGSVLAPPAAAIPGVRPYVIAVTRPTPRTSCSAPQQGEHAATAAPGSTSCCRALVGTGWRRHLVPAAHVSGVRR